MKLLLFDDFKLGVLRGDAVVDVSDTVKDIPHTGPGDLMNGLMTLGMHHSWRQVAARQTIASPDGPALDLATGTGDLAIDLAEVHPHRTVVAADFSLGMLAVARDKLQGLEETRRVRLLAADAYFPAYEALPWVGLGWALYGLFLVFVTIALCVLLAFKIG